MRPMCFVLMPFGVKIGHGGTPIDFDQVYDTMIRPAVEAADLEPIRADEERVGGSIHKPMFERLQLCEFAVADLTSGNANVFYELGIRHALRPCTTVMIFRKDYTLPFDVASMRGLAYDDASLDEARAALTQRLQHARNYDEDSPVYEYLSDLPRQTLDHSKTDLFREHVEYSNKLKQQLAAACALGKAGVARLHEIRAGLGNLADCEAGVLVDLYLSYRKLEAFADMENLYNDLPKPLTHNRIVREQLAFALNRLGRRTEARDILEDIIAANGANPETNGLLGRVYKDLFVAAQGDLAAKLSPLAKGQLKLAIETYLKGFQADWRDAYPGINAVSMMELMDPPDPRQAEVLPVVKFAVKQKVAQRGADYWDYVTLLELAVLEADEDSAWQYLSDALPLGPKLGDNWAPNTTANNLQLIRTKRVARGLPMEWVEGIETQLRDAAKRLSEGKAS